MLTPSAIWADLKGPGTSRLWGEGWGLRLPDLPPGWMLTQPPLTLQLTMGRLGKVAEDKEPIRQQDLTSVSHDLAGPGEEAKGEHPVQFSGP